MCEVDWCEGSDLTVHIPRPLPHTWSVGGRVGNEVVFSSGRVVRVVSICGRLHIALTIWETSFQSLQNRSHERSGGRSGVNKQITLRL